MRDKSFSRRQFLQGASALIVSFNLFPPASKLLAQPVLPLTEPDPAALDSWLAVAQDGKVTVFTSKVDLGTGIETALAQIVAEELDVPFKQIRMEIGDTAGTVDQSPTTGSRTVERAGPQLRQAAAAARQELLNLASARLSAPVEQLTVNDGVVSVIGYPGKSISYARLMGGKRFNVTMKTKGSGRDMDLALGVQGKDPKQYKLVGTSAPRIDLPPKVTGEFTYAQDVEVPGMLHGRVVRPPVVNSPPASVTEDSIKDIPDVVKVVREGSFVGVVAKTEWSAIQAAQALKVTWSEPATKLPGNAEELYTYLKDTKSFREENLAIQGDSAAALSQASKTFEATYRFPFQLHGMLGPSCAVADVRDNRATIWTGTQGPFRTRKAIADLLGFPEKNVRIIYREGSGCYGRLSTDDVAEDAAVLSRSVGKPVRVQWMREEEHAWEPKGPAQLVTVRAGVDAESKIIAWDFTDRSFPRTAAEGWPLLASRQIGLKPKGQGTPNGSQGGGEVYAFENRKIVSALIPWMRPDETPLRTSNLRAPGQVARCFASECFMDEIAAALSLDPVQFRIRYLNQDRRATETLLAAAERAGWQERSSPVPGAGESKGSGRGIALTERSDTYVAVVAEVEIDKSNGKVWVKRVTVAHDCGLVVNPDGAKNQIEGNIIQGVSRALMEEVQFNASGMTSLDWSSYPILKFSEVPDIDVLLLNRPGMRALGAGEPSISPVVPAIANAIFDATGIRLREIPFTPRRVLAALSAL
jgi:CO/xanthine dehydrogenase Mo-binding subunit